MTTLLFWCSLNRGQVKFRGKWTVEICFVSVLWSFWWESRFQRQTDYGRNWFWNWLSLVVDKQFPDTASSFVSHGKGQLTVRFWDLYWVGTGSFSGGFVRQYVYFPCVREKWFSSTRCHCLEICCGIVIWGWNWALFTWGIFDTMVFGFVIID